MIHLAAFAALASLSLSWLSLLGQDSSADVSIDPIPALLASADPARLTRDIETLVSFGTRHTLSETESEVRGIGAARRWLKSELLRISEATGGRLQVREQRFTARVGPTEAELVNVYGFLPGRIGDELGRTYIVSGHYDSRASRALDAEALAPGANDDGSGTAVVLEVARLLAGAEFEANLVFLLVPGEEQGLFGSKHFASEAVASGLDVEGMITNDIVGGTEGGNGVRDEVTIRCYSAAEGVDSTSRAMARALASSATKYVSDAKVKLVFRTDRFGRGGDHQPFHDAGFPALRLTEANEHYGRQHQDVRVEEGVAYGDLAEFVSGDYMARVARVNAAAIAEMALAPPPPTNVSMRAAVSYDTQLGWTPSFEDAEDGVLPAHSYDIVWRDSISPVWTNEQSVPAIVRVQAARRGRPERRVVQGKVEGATADTHYFGVRAVSAAGHRSRVVMPSRP
ncbi:Bacterial leucyl aminopeptidase precursor [Planctomycetes bacterium Poly30]|uniref:Bacterial leucyl aminopeptidase n=1 Tax=Saltatorellus ferox TaxID=2528018 RepID=A0A518EPT2_9BACT|nr:Bacterial leucyl aminopeptidase precursor [Planctomycetes bacterium Poly30]